MQIKFIRERKKGKLIGTYFVCNESEVLIEVAKTINPNQNGFLGCVDKRMAKGKVKVRTWGKLKTSKIEYVYDRRILCES